MNKKMISLLVAMSIAAASPAAHAGLLGNFAKGAAKKAAVGLVVGGLTAYAAKKLANLQQLQKQKEEQERKERNDALLKAGFYLVLLLGGGYLVYRQVTKKEKEE